MQVFIYRSEKYRDVFGFTPDKGGENLPADFGPWKAEGHAAMHAGAPVAGVSGGTDVVLEGIKTEGFYLARMTTNVTRFPGIA
jgi:hypothetical protein